MKVFNNNYIVLYRMLIFCCCCCYAMLISPVTLSGQSAGSRFVPSIEESDFVLQQLPEKNLRAFEERAEQKLKDFIDYLNMLSDVKYDKVLRKQAYEMALTLFENESQWHYTGTKNSNNNLLENSLEQFLKKQVELHKLKQQQQYEIQTIDLITPFTPQETAPGYVRYHGQLSFLFLINERGQSLPKPYSGICYIHLQKVNKDFGEERFEVWEVLLGDVEIMRKK